MRKPLVALATLIRGETRAPLDDLSATQAAAYATFLQQVPWYKWDFTADAAALGQTATIALRDRNAALPLASNFAPKPPMPSVIEAAVAGVGADAIDHAGDCQRH